MNIPLLLRLLPSRLAAGIITKLASKRFQYQAGADEKSWLETGERLEYGDDLYARKWGAGPLVVLVHGWGGAAAQWHKVAPVLVKDGYTVVAPDISGHGDSKGTDIRFDYFYKDLKTLFNFLGAEEPHALIGHSAGGLGMMAGRELCGLKAKKYVCIAAPSTPYPPVKIVKRKLNPPDKALDTFRHNIAGQFNSQWDDITEMSFQKDADAELLLIYDENDKYLDSCDLEKILQHWPDAQTHTVRDIGHEGLIKNHDIAETISDFIR